MGFWPVVEKVIKESDIVALILDSRMPELSENSEVENLVKRYKKDLVRVFNKCDLISKEEFFKLKREYPDGFFVSGIKNLGLSNLKKGLLMKAHQRGIEDPLIGIVGYPNVGKSAIINALSKRAKARVSNIAGTTKNIQWIKAGELRILDSPGVIPSKDNEVKLGLLGAKNPSKIKNPDRLALEIIRKVIEKNRRNLEEFYGFSIVDDDEYEILLEIGKAKKFLVKGGRVDENRTAFQIIRDWYDGKIRA